MKSLEATIRNSKTKGDINSWEDNEAAVINGFKNIPTDDKVPKEMTLRKKATATTIQPYPGVSENLALAIRLK